MAIPGIVLAAGQPGHSIGLVKQLCSCTKLASKQKIYQVNSSSDNANSWGHAAVITRLAHHQAIYQGADDLIVLFDGYLSDVTIPVYNIQHNYAETVAELFRKDGVDALQYLRGSYVGAIIDTRTGRIWLFTDRRASRPLYYAQAPDKSVLIAPEMGTLARSLGNTTDVRASAIGEFLISGTYYGDGTFFNNIKRLQGGDILEIEDNNISVASYWHFEIAPIYDVSEAALLNQIDSLMRQSVRRLQSVISNPFMFLSGGMDSRVVLAYLLENKCNLPVACYWNSDVGGDDAQAAMNIAQQYQLPRHDFQINRDAFVASMERAVLESDCCTEVIDAAQLVEFWAELGAKFDTFVNGDVALSSFFRRDREATPTDAVGWFSLSQVSRVYDWFKMDTALTIDSVIKGQLHKLTSDTHCGNPQDITDVLYYRERSAKLINGFTSAKLHYLEQARPMLDEDVVDFIAHLPGEYREGKTIMTRLLRSRFPDIYRMPCAQRDVLPVPRVFAHWFEQDNNMRNYIYLQLIENLDPRLAAMLDERQYVACINAVLTDQPLPAMRGEWMRSVPLLWRIAKAKENRVHPITAALRMLQLSIYLKSIN